MTTIHESEGRTAFGHDAPGYDSIRPAYPVWMFNLLQETGALGANTNTLEIGPGSGLATRGLIAAGASPLTLLEPDERFMAQLTSLRDHKGDPCKLIHRAFEQATPLPDDFDLVVLATTFHWLDPLTRIKRLAAVTRPGGYVALLWHVFQDMDLPDPFHDATFHLLDDLASSPSGRPDALPFALDRPAREIEFTRDGLFLRQAYAESRWPLTIDAEGVRRLYSGFSNLSRLAPDRRETILDELGKIAVTEFGGRVVRNMTSVLYLFRRAP